MNRIAIDDGVSVAIETIDHEMAEMMLDMNSGNRAIKPGHLQRIIEELKNDRWRFNGQPIIVSDRNRLLDGQNRLMAVVKTRVPIRALVVYGVSDDAFATIDTGRPRSNGDVISIAGYDRSSTIAAAITAMRKIDTGKWDLNPSRTEMLTLVQNHKSMAASELFVRRAMTGDCPKGFFAPAQLTALHYLFTRRDSAEADQFIEDLTSGAGLSADDAVHLLRRRIIADLGSTSKMKPIVKCALAIKAWNHRITKGGTLGVLRWKQGDEGFPVIRGRK